MRALALALIIFSVGFTKIENLSTQTFDVAKGSNTVVNPYLDLLKAADLEIMPVYTTAPNGVQYRIGLIYYSKLLNKKIVRIIRKMDFNNPVKDKDGKVRYYKYKKVDKKIQELDKESMSEIKSAIEAEWEK